ncbi:MAG TPA: bifunctional demethylmenaquinone methyltransferase/2-methoxy-6-polyprenyl-1,4-benzoquinol methylase UbiE [Terriglobales bacterium]|nr:bifunctional demethylmenaquinone methyltransferase/2-methoxy-6-polyprenyl-1,4-benzoquinol methylase UbiE [Terriglobales bacterium]
MLSEQIRGATPEGARDRESAARAIREMFTAIAPRYDLLNHLLSANIDKLWWRRTARTFTLILNRPGAKVLDLCCGTGDMAFALRRESQEAEITGADFSHTMLLLAAKKTLPPRPVKWIEADALQLPFPDQSFDLVTSAFGFRNLADYNAGLCEIRRILRPNGECGILEFSEPEGAVGKIYDVYFKSVLPRVGRLISGNNGAYSYLPSSVEKFPLPEEMLSRMHDAGFRNVSWTPYTFGIAGLYRGTR